MATCIENMMLSIHVAVLKSSIVSSQSILHYCSNAIDSQCFISHRVFWHWCMLPLVYSYNRHQVKERTNKAMSIRLNFLHLTREQLPV